jgi:hypothetical protein
MRVFRPLGADPWDALSELAIFAAPDASARAWQARGETISGEPMRLGNSKGALGTSATRPTIVPEHSTGR